MNFDHVALVSKNIKHTITWYVEKWNAKVLYQDETWGLITIGQTKIAFVSPNQHPAHVCFEIDKDFIVKNIPDKKFTEHRDGSLSCYVKDPDDNFIEFLFWPDTKEVNNG